MLDSTASWFCSIPLFAIFVFVYAAMTAVRISLFAWLWVLCILCVFWFRGYVWYTFISCCAWGCGCCVTARISGNSGNRRYFPMWGMVGERMWRGRCESWSCWWKRERFRITRKIVFSFSRVRGAKLDLAENARKWSWYMGASVVQARSLLLNGNNHLNTIPPLSAEAASS